MYGNDEKIVRIVENSNNCNSLQLKLNKLVSWCLENKLTLNLYKCYKMSYFRINNSVLYNYTIVNNLLKRCTTFEDLEVGMDSSLSFVQHYMIVYLEVLGMLGFIIRNTKDFVSAKCLMLLYCSYVRSTLEHCVVVWCSFYSIYIRRLKNVQRKNVEYTVCRIYCK